MARSNNKTVKKKQNNENNTNQVRNNNHNVPTLRNPANSNAGKILIWIIIIGTVIGIIGGLIIFIIGLI